MVISKTQVEVMVSSKHMRLALEVMSSDSRFSFADDRLVSLALILEVERFSRQEAIPFH